MHRSQDENMKNKYRVFIYTPIFCFIMFVLGTSGFILTLPMTDPNESKLWVILSFIFITLLPFLLFVWSFSRCGLVLSLRRKAYK